MDVKGFYGALKQRGVFKTVVLSLLILLPLLTASMLATEYGYISFDILILISGASAALFMLLVYVSWSFEIRPEGIRKRNTYTLVDGEKIYKNRNLFYGTMTILLLVLAGLLGSLLFTDTAYLKRGSEVFSIENTFKLSDAGSRMALSVSRLNTGTATDSDLFVLSSMALTHGWEGLFDEVIRASADSTMRFYLQHDEAIYKENYEGLIKLLDERAAATGKAKGGHELISAYLIYYTQTGKFNEGLELMRKEHPALFSENVTGKPDGIYAEDVAWISIMLSASGDTKQAAVLNRLVCNEMTGDFGYGGDYMLERVHNLKEYLYCLGAEGDEAELTALTKVLYFDRQMKTDLILTLDASLNYYRIQDSKRFKALKKQMKSDYEEEGEIIREVLQGQGLWKEEWAAEGL